MRGNWDATESLILATSEQHPGKKTMEDQQLPLHSPTTPGWGAITDRIVEEGGEDKNNDSGVSPGHYASSSTSPRSRRSSGNCSLSPNSASSPDPNAMQCEGFVYCQPSIEYGRLDTVDKSSHDEKQPNESHRRETTTTTTTTTTESTTSTITTTTITAESEISQKQLVCPVCSYTANNRLQFSEHLTIHYARKDDDSEDLKKSNNERMSVEEDENRASPSHSERSELEFEEMDEPGLRVPRVNSQGKVKTFRCKQCNYVAITKLDFWEHSRGHIKVEKLLTCPKCPFVTEYKHHLEYHLRNHFGSKPFKCDKCMYSCVNKSMLNSHLKSHSNVYQYRCANCSYATKYCHSLKLHLRKYTHQPAMVLNADGSPNPLPIIDVYGTRRGPKQKPSATNSAAGKETEEAAGTSPSSIGDSASNGQQIAQLPVGSMAISQQIAMNALQALKNGHPAMPFPYARMMAGYPMGAHYLADDSSEKHQQFEQLKSNLLAEYAKVIANERMTASVGYHPELMPTFTSNDHSDLPNIGNPGQIGGEEKSAVSAAPENGQDPLDLSKPDAADTAKSPSVLNCLQLETPSVSNCETSSAASNASIDSPKTKTNRRKGKAVKLDRRVVQRDEEDNNDEKNEGNENEDSPASPTLPTGNRTVREKPSRSFADRTTAETTVGKQEAKETTGVAACPAAVGNEFTCQYCDIAFGNVIMYTVHMGYHGFNDPFTCNMCGEQCVDKLSFFLHIARSQHS